MTHATHAFAAACLLAMLLPPSPAAAGVPDPFRTSAGLRCLPEETSRWGLAPGPHPLQYRFRADGGLDELVALLTLRDCMWQPVEGRVVTAGVTPAPGTPAFCRCEPTQTAVTRADGTAEFRFRRIGGRGQGQVRMTLWWDQDSYQWFWPLPFDFTSPDLSGSCESGSSTTVVDLGLFAAGMSGYRRESDFDCNGTVNIIDLGIWSSGLGKGCP